MSKSKRAVSETGDAAPERRGRWLRTPSGAIKAGWLLAVSLLCYALTAMALRRGLNALFQALFRAWGIGPENAVLAPAWARQVYIWHGSAVTLAVSVALLLLSARLRRLWLGRAERPLFSGKSFFGAALVGLGGALALLLLCLIPDSLRLSWPLSAPRWKWSQPALWALSLLAALSEEVFLKRVLYDGVRSRWGRWWAFGAVCAVFFLSNGGYAGNVPCAVNVLLLGGVCCGLYERFGLWASTGFRWGWSVATVFLMGFGGGDNALYRLYSVSEELLTGGEAGLIYGLWATLALAGLLLWLLRPRPRFKGWGKRRSARA